MIVNWYQFRTVSCNCILKVYQAPIRTDCSWTIARGRSFLDHCPGRSFLDHYSRRSFSDNCSLVGLDLVTSHYARYQSSFADSSRPCIALSSSRILCPTLDLISFAVFEDEDCTALSNRSFSFCSSSCAAARSSAA